MTVLGVVILCLFISEIVYAHGNGLLSLHKRCVATATQVGACHSCVCTTSGVYHCRTERCSDDIRMSNVTIFHRDDSLPEIRDGDVCNPGQMYKNECNTCKCTQDGGLMCTKMACINWTRPPKEGTTSKKVLKTLNKPKSGFLPKLPKGSCKPGKIYRSGCRRCFCNDKNKIICSKKKNDACVFDKEGNPYPIRTPEDVRPSFPVSLRAGDIETLSSASEKCEPGKTYRVDCNNCICLSSSDLVCQQKLCISYQDMNRLEAEEMSGQPCSPDERTATKCVNCQCVKGVTACQAERDCEPALTQQLSSGRQIKSEISVPHENCVPDTVYKVNCNKCYCQPDGTLRCTQKSCLNYSQINLLKKQRDYLEKHGL